MEGKAPGEFKAPLPHPRLSRLSTSSQASDIQAGHCDWFNGNMDDNIFDEIAPCIMPHRKNNPLKINNLHAIAGDFHQLNTKRVSTSTPFSSRTVSHSNDSGFQEPESDCFTCSSVNRTEGYSGALSTEAFSMSYSSISMSTHLLSNSEIPQSPVPIDIPKFCLDPDFSQIQERAVNVSHDSDSAYGDGSAHSSLHSQQFSDCMSVCSSDSHRMDNVFEGLDIGSSGCTANVLLKSSSQRPATPDLSQTSVIKDITDQYSPREADRLIGRKMGLEFVDIIKELYNRNIAALDFILEFVGAQDLTTMCKVSKQWNNAVTSNPKAHQRKISFIESRKSRSQKENCYPKCSDVPARMTGTKGPLTAVQFSGNCQPSCTLNKPIQDTNQDKFHLEAQKLKCDESLRQCPKCRSPAKTHSVQERAQCCSKQCGYDFCIKCRGVFHGSKDCSFSISKKTRTDGTVATKKSKKNLRRL